MTTRIIGTGSAVPEKTWTNDDLTAFIDTSDEWIHTRTGIRKRQIAGENENVVTLAEKAARRAMEDGHVKPEEIQLVLVATCSYENFFPGVACQVQARLGLKNAVAMDLSAACSGFLFALHTAHAYIKSGIYEKALIIGAETLSRIIDWKDRSSCVLFGDAAGACVVKRSDVGIEEIVQWSDGGRGSVLTASASMLKTPEVPATDTSPLKMDGQEVFKFAVKTVPECIREVLEKKQITLDEVDGFILHQANKRIIQSVAKRLGISEEKCYINLDEHGNTSAASIPLLLDELNKKKKLQRGDRLILSAFGAGLTWGATLLQW